MHNNDAVGTHTEIMRILLFFLKKKGIYWRHDSDCKFICRLWDIHKSVLDSNGLEWNKKKVEGNNIKAQDAWQEMTNRSALDLKSV